jgi:heme-degrading monooxygenase HmoA
MFARVTQFDIDTVRISMAEATARFAADVAPEMRKQPGYRGAYVLHTPEGRGLLVTLWETEADAAAGIASGYYAEQLGKFVTLYRSPPGREHYEVAFAEVAAGQPQPA